MKILRQVATAVFALSVLAGCTSQAPAEGILVRRTVTVEAAPPAPPPPPTIDLVVVGDIMLDRRPGEAVARGEDPFASFATVLQGADLAIGNLECPVATEGTRIQKLYNFRCHPRVIPLLKQYLGVVSIANNHSGDSGQDGFLNQLELLEAGGLAYVGGGRNFRDAHRPVVVEQSGLRLALLAYNEVELRSYEAGLDSPGLAWSVDEQVVADIRLAREAADLVVVYPHWGEDYYFEPTERQRKLARLMIDAGATLVVGGHPHVTEGAEYYKDGLIVYSLGNFIFDDFLDVPPELDEPSRTSWVLRVTLGREGIVSWDTLVARTDDTGFPRPVPGAESPCDKQGAKEIQLCKGD